MKALISFILVVSAMSVSAQKLDSIYFNLYTDSLKKGTYNYINVEGRYDNGRYLPLTNKELLFSSPDGHFEGNSLFIDSSFRGEKVKITVITLAKPSLKKELEIYIKKYESTDPLPTMNDVMTPGQQKKRSRRR